MKHGTQDPRRGKEFKSVIRKRESNEAFLLKLHPSAKRATELRKNPPTPSFDSPKCVHEARHKNPEEPVFDHQTYVSS